MNSSISKRFGLATLLSAAIALPLCGCGDPNGIQENPYAAPAEPGDNAGSDTAAVSDEESADADTSNTTE